MRLEKGLKRLIGVMAGFGLISILGGCGSTASTSGPRPHSTPTSSPAVAVGSAADSTITLGPQTYESPTNPCAGVGSTSDFWKVPAACQVQFAGLGPSSADPLQQHLMIPGQSLMDNSPMTRTVSIQSGVDKAQATALATAFFRWENFFYWAAASNATGSMRLLESQAAQTPLGEAVLHNRAVYSVAACDYPTSVRIVQLSSSASKFLLAHGQVPTKLALVATFAPCAGDQAGSDKQGAGPIFINAQPQGYSNILTENVVQVAPFGTVIRLTGYATCGEFSGLSADCGVGKP